MSIATTDRQRLVEYYCAAYSRGDHADAVTIFTDDVRWICAGFFDVTGRDAYLAQMPNPSAVGHPDIRVERFFEDGDTVVAEGSVQQGLVDGGAVDIAFLDAFEFRGSLVCEKRSYVMNR